MSPINFSTGKIGFKKNNVNIIVSKKLVQFSVKYLLKLTWSFLHAVCDGGL